MKVVVAIEKLGLKREEGLLNGKDHGWKSEMKYQLSETETTWVKTTCALQRVHCNVRRKDMVEMVINVGKWPWMV